MDSLKNQLEFDETSDCEEFVVNKMRLILPRGDFICFNCGLHLYHHRKDVVSEEYIDQYFAHIGGRSGASCVIDDDHGKIYLGSYGTSIEPFISDHLIGAVINCSDLHLIDRPDFVRWNQKVVDLEDKGIIKVLRLGWIDESDQNIWKYEKWDQLVDALQFIHAMRNISSSSSSSKNVLIHCAQGKSRSATVMIAYIMATLSFNLDEAFSFVRSKRPIASPNIGFLRQLKEFENSAELKQLKEKFSK